MPLPPPLPSPPFPTDARSRLLASALKLFAERGYAATSTRALADEAGTNVAAIRYYFGDKQGLYRATFTEAMGTPPRDRIHEYGAPGLTLRAALAAYYAVMLDLLDRGDIAAQCARLHLREFLEPTSQWDEEMEQDVRRPHQALVQQLARLLGAPADDGLHRLAFAIAAPAFYLFAGRDALLALRPHLIDTPAACAAWRDRLVEDALALCAAERRRRRAAPPPPAAPTRRTARRSNP